MQRLEVIEKMARPERFELPTFWRSRLAYLWRERLSLPNNSTLQIPTYSSREYYKPET